MMAGRLIEETGTIFDPTTFFIASTKVEPADAGKRDRSSTHGAGLQRDVKIAIRQALAAQVFAGLPNGQDFCMCRRIAEFARPVAGPGDDRAGGINDDGTNRDLMALRGGFRLRQRQLHVAPRQGSCHKHAPNPVITKHVRTHHMRNQTPKPKPSAQSRRRPDAGKPATEAVTDAGGAMRIAKAMARAGLCSRREAERWIEAGRVSINGTKLTTPAVTVTPQDRVVVDGKPLPAAEPTRLWRHHKPRGRVTTHSDPQQRETVFANLPPNMPRVVSIGRLDYNTEGLLLLTNSGELARHLELPSTGWLRRYRVRAHGRVSQQQLDKLQNGITIDGQRFAAIEATLDSTQGGNVWLSMSLREGKNREIRRVLETLNLSVNRLIRVSYGPFQLGDLAPGTVEEIRTRVIAEQLGRKLAGELGLAQDAKPEGRTGTAKRAAHKSRDKQRKKT